MRLHMCLKKAAKSNAVSVAARSRPCLQLFLERKRSHARLKTAPDNRWLIILDASSRSRGCSGQAGGDSKSGELRELRAARQVRAASRAGECGGFSGEGKQACERRLAQRFEAVRCETASLG